MTNFIFLKESLCMINKFFCVTLLFIFQFNYAMEIVYQTPEKIWRENFWKLSLDQYNQSVGYNLDLQLWPDYRGEVKHTFPSLLAHGWSASSTTMTEYARVDRTYRIPGDAVTFRFKDAFTNSGSFILHSSFGQINDIKSFLVALRAMYDCKVPGCNLFGQSRGGGTIPNALAVLNTETRYWDKGFGAIKSFFEDEDRIKIIAMIKKGVVVLDTPMITSQAGINAHVNKIFGRLFYVKKVVSFLMDRIILPIITRGNYSSSGPQALTSVKNLPVDLKVAVSYQKNDESVGNLYDKEFAQALVDRLGQKNVWIVLGNDGGRRFDDIKWQELQQANKAGCIQKRFGIGLPYRDVPAHNAGYFPLLELGFINRLFAYCGGSYLSDKDILTQGVQILRKSQPESLDDYFTDDNYNMHDDGGWIDDIMRSDDSNNSKRHYIIGLIAILFNFLMYSIGH